jgi:hypothetical protein
MADASIPGIPTLYQGRRYRSRLEARWACFFDLLGWHYEYEPCDLDGWIPDFALCEASPVFVEVKPVTAFPQKVASKIESALEIAEVLIVGMTLPLGVGIGAWSQRPSVGWLREHYDFDDLPLWAHGMENISEEGYLWGLAPFGRWVPERLGFCHGAGYCGDRITGTYTGREWGTLPLDCTHVQSLWAEAGNVTQWKKNEKENRRPPVPSGLPLSPEYVLLVLLCHHGYLLEQVQLQLSPEDFHDADLRAIYAALVARTSDGTGPTFRGFFDASPTPRQTQLLTQIAMESTLTNPTEISATICDCVTRIRARQPRVMRQRIQEQLRAVSDGSVEQQRLLQEYNRLSKEGGAGV